MKIDKRKKIDEIINAIRTQGILPLFYHEDFHVSKNVIQSLYEGGFRAIEYTNRGSMALENFRALKKLVEKEMPDLFLGIGTIKTSEQGKLFRDAKADFIVSPILNTGLGDFCHENTILWIPGCFTPSEIHTAQNHHADIVKLFPANVLGPEFLAAVRSVFPDQLFIPTGGVELEEEQLRNWFKAGVCAVGLGSNLINSSLLETHDFDQLKAKSIEALAFIKTIRGI